MEQVVVTGAFPDLRVHDDGAIEADHIVGAGGLFGLNEFVVVLAHVLPPRFFDISFQFDAEGTVVPETIESAVDFAGLEKKSVGFAMRNEFVHQVFNCHGFFDVLW